MNDELKAIIFGFILGLIIMVGVWIIVEAESFNISQETGDDICRQLTGNESAVAESDYGKLICLTPSYDETHNIIIKSNQEDK